MKIDRITLENYKLFEHAEFDLHEQFTLFVGRNGSGKSSILSAAAVALGVFVAIRAVTLNSFLLKPGLPHSEFLPQIPGVVIIDELDVHLHPEWQHGIAATLMSIFPKVQFICSSHSPLVIGNLPPECLRIYESTSQEWKRPRQSVGQDSNWILEVLMSTSLGC